MNFSLPFCLQCFKQTRGTLQSYPRIQLLLSLNKCTNLSAVVLSQTSTRKPRNNTTEKERIEVILLKNLLTSNQLGENRLITKENIQNSQLQRTVHINNQRTSHSEYKQRLLVWEDVLLSPRFIITKDKKLKPNLKDTLIDLMAIKPLPETWCCNAVRHAHSQKRSDMKGFCLQFSAKNKGVNNNRFVERRTTIGPSPEQLSLVLLRLREELPCFFEGRHRYSIYSEDLLFVNKLTRTTTRYIDGFSIFEVGRDGLIHCHRLDKVIPTSSAERQKWSLKMQILTLLGLAEINRGPCEAFQVKNQDMLKKV